MLMNHIGYDLIIIHNFVCIKKIHYIIQFNKKVLGHQSKLLLVWDNILLWRGNSNQSKNQTRSQQCSLPGLLQRKLTQEKISRAKVENMRKERVKGQVRKWRLNWVKFNMALSNKNRVSTPYPSTKRSVNYEALKQTLGIKIFNPVLYRRIKYRHDRLPLSSSS